MFYNVNCDFKILVLETDVKTKPEMVDLEVEIAEVVELQLVEQDMQIQELDPVQDVVMQPDATDPLWVEMQGAQPEVFNKTSSDSGLGFVAVVHAPWCRCSARPECQP